MAKNEKELQCLSRLLKFTACYDTMIDFFKQECGLTDNDLREKFLHRDPANTIHAILQEAQQNGHVTLVYYEWNLLPKEYINVFITATMNTQEFIYSQA